MDDASKAGRAVDSFSALGQEHRLAVFRFLLSNGEEGVCAGDIAQAVGISPSNLSFHLAQLEKSGLIVSMRQKRNSIYRTDFEGLRFVLRFLTETCCDGDPNLCIDINQWLRIPKCLNILFLCTANSARSIMAESLLNALGKGRFQAYSAGFHPFGGVHPYAKDILKENGFPTRHLRSKSWKEFKPPTATLMDFIVIVCSDGGELEDLLLPSKNHTQHWDLPDPFIITGSEEKRRQAFRDVFTIIEKKIAIFIDEVDAAILPDPDAIKPDNISPDNSQHHIELHQT